MCISNANNAAAERMTMGIGISLRRASTAWGHDDDLFPSLGKSAFDKYWNESFSWISPSYKCEWETFQWTRYLQLHVIQCDGLWVYMLWLNLSLVKKFANLFDFFGTGHTHAPPHSTLLPLQEKLRIQRAGTESKSQKRRVVLLLLPMSLANKEKYMHT